MQYARMRTALALLIAIAVGWPGTPPGNFVRDATTGEISIFANAARASSVQSILDAGADHASRTSRPMNSSTAGRPIAARSWADRRPT